MLVDMSPVHDPTAVVRAYADAVDAQAWSHLRALLSDDFRCWLVRTGERFGPDDYVAFNRDYPGAWRFLLEDVVATGDRVAARVQVSDGAETFHVALFGVVVAGRLTALDEVWTEDKTPTITDTPTTGATDE